MLLLKRSHVGSNVSLPPQVPAYIWCTADQESGQVAGTVFTDGFAVSASFLEERRFATFLTYCGTVRRMMHLILLQLLLLTLHLYCSPHFAEMSITSLRWRFNGFFVSAWTEIARFLA